MENEKVTFPPLPCPDLFLVPMGEKCLEVCFQKALALRHLGWSVEIDLSGKKIKHGLQLANELHARFCVVVGDQELATQNIEVKEMNTHTSHQIAWNDLEAFLKNRRTQ
jgi:histidyl-tRNA synthetase